MPPLRPLSASEIIDETFQLYRRNFVLFVTISAVLMVPMTLVQVLEQISVLRQNTTSGLLTVGLMSLVVALIRVFVYLGIMSAIIHAASEIRMGRNPSVTESYLRGLDQLPSMIKAALLLFVILTLTFITIVGIPIAVYLSVAWLLAMPVAVIEREGAFACLSRSRSLVKGQWWRVLGITILVSMIVSLLSLIFSVPGLAAGIPLILRHDTQPISAGSAAISVLFSNLGTIITGPIIYIAWLLLYYDLRARKEGLDLEMMAHQAEDEARTASSYP